MRSRAAKAKSGPKKKAKPKYVVKKRPSVASEEAVECPTKHDSIPTTPLCEAFLEKTILIMILIYLTPFLQFPAYINGFVTKF